MKGRGCPHVGEQTIGHRHVRPGARRLPVPGTLVQPGLQRVPECGAERAFQPWRDLHMVEQRCRAAGRGFQDLT